MTGELTEIKTLQEAEKKGELDKVHGFIFDMDSSPVSIHSSKLVRVLQWDRYSLENYLINRKVLFDVLQEIGYKGLGSRGEFEKLISELAMSQLKERVIKDIYMKREPDNAGIRPSEITSKNYRSAAALLSKRLVNIRQTLSALNEEQWQITFIDECQQREKEIEEDWRNNWLKLCSGKQLFDDLYKKSPVQLSKPELKKRVMRKMLAERTEEWTLVRSKIIEAVSE